MKRLVVLLLTAVMVTGVCLTPTIAYATATSVGSDEEADGGSSKGVVDNSTEDDVETESFGNKAGVSNDYTDTSNEDESEGENTSGVTTDEPTTKADDVVDVETVPQSFEQLDDIVNVGGLRSHISTGSYIDRTIILKKDIIVLGYNSDTSGKPSGYVYPEIGYTEDTGYTLMYATQDYEENDEGDAVPVVDENGDVIINWNTLQDVQSIDDSIKYVKDNVNNLILSAGVPGDIYAGVLGADSPEYLIVYSGSGDYVGSYRYDEIAVTTALYDESFIALTADFDHSIRYDENKECAFLTVNYDLHYPKAAGDVMFLSFTIEGNEEGQTILDGVDTAVYLNGVQGTSSGTIKDIKIESEEATTIVVSTNFGKVRHNFTVDTLNNKVEDNAVNKQDPKVTFSDLPSNATKGNPVTVTMYSDIDAVLMFNGRSSGAPVKSYDFTITQNGSYSWSATTESGGSSNGSLSVNCFNSELASANYGNYGTGGISSLPKTGGLNTVSVVMVGLLSILGGISILKKDSILALASVLRRKVSL